MIHIPAAEIGQFLIKLSKNSSFLRIGRILMISLVTLSAIGCAGIWVKGLEPWMPGCTVPKWGCYSGPPLSLLEYIDQLGATKYLLLLPLIDSLAAIILLFQPRRTYFNLLLMSFVAVFLPMLGGDPHPYMNVASGNGYWLHISSATVLFLLSISLAVAEPAGAINKKTSWEQDWGLKE